MIAAGAALTDEAGASVTPDTFIRVFMTIREADANIVSTAGFRAAPDARRLHGGRVGRGAATQNLVTDRAGERKCDPHDTMEP